MPGPSFSLVAVEHVLVDSDTVPLLLVLLLLFRGGHGRTRRGQRAREPFHRGHNGDRSGDGFSGPLRVVSVGARLFATAKAAAHDQMNDDVDEQQGQRNKLSGEVQIEQKRQPLN